MKQQKEKSQPVAVERVVNCVSFGDFVAGRYYSNCGEKLLDTYDFKLKHYIEETFECFTHFDNKFFKSVNSQLLDLEGL